MITHKRFSVRTSRGAASVEAVVFLPFMLMLYFGVALIHGRYDAAQRAWAGARSCAWAYSQQGCTGPLPEACSAQAVAPNQLPQSDDLNDAVATNDVQQDDELSGAVSNKLGEPRETLFGKYTNVTGSAEYQSPRMFGGARTVSASYHLACNLEPQTLGSMVGALFDSVKSAF